MRLFKLLSCFFLFLTLFGCSSNNYDYPKEFGESTLENFDEVTELNAYEKINTYIDFIKYIKKSNYKDSYSVINDAKELLIGDYEDVGDIHLPGQKYLLYIKTDGLYYPCDFENAESKWLSEYDVETTYQSIDDMKEAFSKIVNGTVTIESFYGTDFVLGDQPYVTVFNKNLPIKKRFGQKVYMYADVQIPLGLGLPTLTDEELDEIIAEEDYESVAGKITTFADAVNYCYRAKITNDYDQSIKYFDDFIYVDSGNIIYNDDSLVYTLSGLELIMHKKAQCTASATLYKYLLEDNYPEIGYVELVFPNFDGHAMLYIKGNDGMYYLLDTENYSNGPHRRTKWLDALSDIYNEFNGCYDTLDELMNNYARIREHTKDGLIGLYTFVFDGVFCHRRISENSLDKDRTIKSIVYPTGSEVKCWFGSDLIEFVDAKHSSQTEIIKIDDYLNQ